MPVIEVEMPDVLKMLHPEECEDVIVIGKKAYKLYPLTEGQVEKVAAIASDVMLTLFPKDMIGSGEFKLDTQGLIKAFFNVLIKENRIAGVIAEVTGLTKELISEEATLPQIFHLASVIYKTNFNRKSLPETTVKNFEGLLNLKEQPVGKTTEQKFIEEMVETMQEMTTTPQKKIDDVLENLKQTWPSQVSTND